MENFESADTTILLTRENDHFILGKIIESLN